MKIFAISIAAHSPFTGFGGEQSGFIYQHSPGLIPAESMDHAADLAQQKAFELWPESEGWTEHRAALIPVTQPFCEAFTRALYAGCLDMAPEEPHVYHF